MHITTYDPSSALLDLHKVLQTTRELGEKRRVIRPTLGPEEYAVTQLFERYEDLDHNQMRSAFDLPHSPNPCLLKKSSPKTSEQSSFGFPEEHLWRNP